MDVVADAVCELGFFVLSSLDAADDSYFIIVFAVVCCAYATFDDCVVDAEKIDHILVQGVGVLPACEDFAIFGDCPEREARDEEVSRVDDSSGLGEEFLEAGPVFIELGAA